MPPDNRPSVFIAYPSVPEQLQPVLEALPDTLTSLRVKSWRQANIAGRFISEGVLSEIDACDILVADITKLNFNVIFEAGYAIGRKRVLLLTLNRALVSEKREITQLGIFDTLGYLEYENSTQLAVLLENTGPHEPVRSFVSKINTSTPIYLLDTLHKTDQSMRIISRLKKARLRYRAFDPNEQPRLSTLDALNNVEQSIAVVVNLLSVNSSDHRENNLRGAFVAGLAMGQEKELLILQEGNEPVPLDYRDFVKIYKHQEDIDRHIAQLAPRVVEGLQRASGQHQRRQDGLLAKLDLGSPAAENEADTLEEYYVPIEEYRRALNGQGRLVVGRKGSGKTALFFRLRNETRQHARTVVLDLKPDSHQLKRFKQMVLQLLQDAVREHVAVAFWEYVLLLELCFRILDVDKHRHTRDHTLYDAYQNLAGMFSNDALRAETDFSERMLQVVNRISTHLEERTDASIGTPLHLSTNEVTEILYTHDIRELRNLLGEYFTQDRPIWILFDNLDKGWPTHGVEDTDTLILRALLEATRKMERFFAKLGVPLRTVVFIRNDVYEILVDRSADRGKDEKISLDWTDPALLREFLRRRIARGDLDEQLAFDEVWAQVCTSHIGGEESSQHLIELSLMRPRNLLTLVNHCKGTAVNLSHPLIQEGDLAAGARAYSADVANEIGLELRDVYPDAENVLYSFIGVRATLTVRELKTLIQHGGSNIPNTDRLIELLLWFAFLGVVHSNGTEERSIYIYDVAYDLRKLRALARGLQDDATICIHRAFWPFLEISSIIE